jgi:uncharacterized Zn finger protein (UPF0148 family)
MITGWLSAEDCPDCGGPLLDISTGPRLLTLACPGCGYAVTWHATDHDDSTDHDADSADPEDEETT